VVEIKREFDCLGFDQYPRSVERMLEQHDWSDSLNKLRTGVVLTFSLYENRNEQYVSWVVDKLHDGRSIFLIRPAWLNKGYDFKVCVEGWEESENPAPTHDEIYSDLYWKREHDNWTSFEAICMAVLDVHDGASPQSVLKRYSDEFNFTVGRTPESLLRVLPWLFIEQDIRYWNYDGRNRTIEKVEQLYDGRPLSELNLDVQELSAIHETPLAIPNQ